ncbi:MAG: presqualene diphosphate synthase HpnD, partial [Dongiaceae bacterium]
RREAMFAVYAFCRAVDDIADDAAPVAVKRARLGRWREEIDRLYAGRPQSPIARALADPVARYGLAREDFLALIDGMEMDAGNAMRAPSMAELELYCARVAGAVGLLSVRVFGATGETARRLALTLGEALQLVNILRDLREDAERGRLYLPRELLAAHGIASRDPRVVLAHPALGAVCDDLAAVARRRFAEARVLLAACPRRPMRPAVVMMTVYGRLLDRLVRRGWTRLDAPVRLSAAEKFWVALRHGVL